MPASALTRLECSRCRREFEPDKVQHVCSCGAPLFARYDLSAVQRSLRREPLSQREQNLWRFRELLPVRSDDAIVSLGERMTPVISLTRVGESCGLRRLFLKDEGLLPT